NGIVTVHGGSLISGNTTSGGGGGIYNNAGVLTVNASTISENAAINTGAVSGGGGIYNFSQLANTTIEAGAMILGNTTNGAGGGIRNNGGNITVHGSKVSGNSGNFYGGISNSGGTATIQAGSLIRGNVSGSDAGGIGNSAILV